MALYDPAAHAEHGPPSGPVNPGLHTLPLFAVDPATDCESARQFKHELSAAAPVDAEYLPAAHSKHADALDAPSVARYVPAAQARHAEAPTVAEYLPVAHIMQAVDASP